MHCLCSTSLFCCSIATDHAAAPEIQVRHTITAALLVSKLASFKGTPSLSGSISRVYNGNGSSC